MKACAAEGGGHSFCHVFYSIRAPAKASHHQGSRPLRNICLEFSMTKDRKQVISCPLVQPRSTMMALKLA